MAPAPSCPAGTSPPPRNFSVAGGTGTACPSGKHSGRLEGAAECTDCRPGRHAPYEASEECVACPEGTYSWGSGAVNCARCSPGAEDACAPTLASGGPTAGWDIHMVGHWVGEQAQHREYLYIAGTLAMLLAVALAWPLCRRTARKARSVPKELLRGANEKGQRERPRGANAAPPALRPPASWWPPRAVELRPASDGTTHAYSPLPLWVEERPVCTARWPEPAAACAATARHRPAEGFWWQPGRGPVAVDDVVERAAASPPVGLPGESCRGSAAGLRAAPEGSGLKCVLAPSTALGSAVLEGSLAALRGRVASPASACAAAGPLWVGSGQRRSEACELSPGQLQPAREIPAAPPSWSPPDGATAGVAGSEGAR